MDNSYRYGDKVWLLPYEEAPCHGNVDRRAWNRIRARDPQTIGSVWRDDVRFVRGLTWIPKSGITKDDPNAYIKIEVGDLL